MINFVICDDNKNIVKLVEDIIDKIMIKNKLAYKKHSFFDYNNKFNKILEEKINSKIYILDIETPSASGIDIARKIREDDIDSVIIFLTSHHELGSILLHDEIMFLTFICKFDDMENRLISAINNSIKMIGIKQAIRFEDRGIIYTLFLNDILFITTSTIDRKTVIVSQNNEYKINKTFNEICGLLNDDFKQTHRSCMVNMNMVRKINKKTNEIEFKNGKKINLLSDSYKKEFKI